MKYIVTKKESTDQKTTVDEPVSLFPSRRLGLAFLTCAVIASMGLLRANLSISLVCMVSRRSAPTARNQSALDFWERNATEWEAPNSSVGSTDVSLHSTVGDSITRIPTTTRFQGEFRWNRQYMGYLLGAYFYGFCVTQLFGGYLAGRFGSKHVIGTATLISTVVTLVSPAVARFNLHLFIGVRAILGLASGVIVPSIQAFWGLWAPPLERSFLFSITGAGINVGYVAASLIAAQFCEVSLDNGWPLTFYFTAFVNFVVWILWNLCAFSCPDDDPKISKRELDYIKSATNSMKFTLKKRKPFPWLNAFTSPAVLAIIAAHASFTWFGHAQTTSLPFYLNDVLKFNIRENGLFTLLQYAVVIVTNPPIAYLVDLIRQKKVLSTTAVRKIAQSIGSFSGGALAVAITFTDYETRYLAVGILILNANFNNFGRYGFLVNPQDIAPVYSGEIFGIANTVGALTGVLAPIIIGQMARHGTAAEWSTIFYITAGLMFVGGAVFLIFAKGEVLPWAKDTEDETVTETKGATVADDINSNRTGEVADTDGANTIAVFVVDENKRFT